MTSIDPDVDGDPGWFQRAVFYEVLTRGFFDANDDGTGDLQGLTAKLDYLQWLGIDCIWMLPFYQSPLRDGGYDISDFFTILPEYGDLGDAVELVEEAHKRGIRIIADLVMNHTSDQHAWFQESRQDRTNPKADWYVWGDDDQRWSEARIIFVDTEKSNWTWDPVRQQYYWHRFFSHQPDLNFDNVEVQEAMLSVVRFWLDIGLDGFRLDAVPYLFERDGTNGENLPETHEYLRTLRREVDATHPGKVLLAEANQWPADVVDYFGKGDECHMCFHFPVMPRMFMAVRREQRYPITEILAQTPEIPDGCQWGMFLRNHDELTLEMVTDEERDYMYAEYAKDPRMRRNVGIARRLAPLVDNNRQVAELLHALLFSLPGSPILYYGDELLMGDNIYLGDRDGVRTPMQWTPDRNGGFSKADFARLYLPPLMDPVYGFAAVNVEGETRDQYSFLHWMRRMLEVRKQHPMFGTGRFEVLDADNPSVLAFVREEGEDLVLCVNNLSRFAQPVELHLQRWEGRTPVELLGRVPFPRVGQLPYFITLGSHSFYWFQLVADPREDGPVIDLELLRAFLPGQRWFNHTEPPTELRIVQLEVLGDGGPDVVWMVVDADGELYQVPVLPPDEPDGELTDAMLDPTASRILFDRATKGAEPADAVRPMGLEQSHTSLVVDERVVFKLYRRLHDGPNPEVELATALAAAGYPHVIEPVATWERDGRDLALVQRYVASATDGWALALASFRDMYGSRLRPDQCGGDFAGEATRLGEVIGRLHLALADCFGTERPEQPTWAVGLAAVARSQQGGDDLADQLAEADAGASIRVHGDLHLGQVLRSDDGWVVVDFEGEPTRPLPERRRLTSPLKDVAGMLRSFGYAAWWGLSERDQVEREGLDELALAWEERNRNAFLAGYFAIEGISELLPAGSDRDLALRGFEVEKAVYEVGYERAHRPDWVGIPEAALARMLTAPAGKEDRHGTA